MGDGEAFHEVDSELLGHIREDSLLLVKRFLISADKTALLVHLEPTQVFLFLDRQRSQYNVIGKILGWRACGVIWKISVMEGMRRRLAVRISELACRCLVKDFDLLDVV